MHRFEIDVCPSFGSLGRGLGLLALLTSSRAACQPFMNACNSDLKASFQSFVGEIVGHNVAEAEASGRSTILKQQVLAGRVRDVV